MIHIILGTRSEVIKLSSVIRELEKRKIRFKVIHSGQHDTLHLMEILNLPRPDYYLGRSLRDKWSKKGKFSAILLALYWGFGVFLKLRGIFQKERPDIIIYNGNTVVVPLTAFAARTTLLNNVTLVHRESGIRNYSRKLFSEDFYYKIGERFADILFCPTEEAVSNLKKENYTKNKSIIYTQNPQVEIIKQVIGLTRPKLYIKQKKYILINTIRSLNTNEKEKEFIDTLLNSPFNIICSINPRIKHNLDDDGYLEKIKNVEHIEIRDPIDYVSFLHLMENSEGVITDSGGVVAEAVILKKPCIILNDWSQYPELEKRGLIKVTGIDKTKIIRILEDIKNKGTFYEITKNTEYLQGDGNATKIIVDTLENRLNGM